MIHIASTYIADVLNSSLNRTLKKFCDQHVCFHYNQIFQQALLPQSEFNENQNGMNVLLIRCADLFKQKHTNNEMLHELIAALNKLQKTMKVPLLILFTPTQTASIEEQKDYIALEHNLKTALEPNINTIFISSQEIETLNKHSLIFDNLTEKYGHIPYTIEYYESLALLIARKYSLFTRKPYKVIVLDCDGTLWRGITEEDGVDALIINEEYLALQQLMIHLFEAGFLLCLCSKNSEKSVLNVFAQRKEMALDINKHICSYRINWLPKSVNIQSLAEELALDVTSFIFIDDNNVECAEVKAAFPGMLVIHLPLIPSKKGKLSPNMNYLKNIWAFDSSNNSAEDKKRTEFYKQNKLRHALQSKSSNYKEFLDALNIKTQIKDATPKDIGRIVQLGQRTNQFNLVPNTLSDIELNQRITQQQPGCCIIEVSDKYGDYGLVGAIIYDITHDDLLVKNFFLSCRILGREIEYTAIYYLAKIAQQHNKKSIRFLFKITDRNIPAIGFIQHLAGKVALQKTDHVILNLCDIPQIAPKSVYASTKIKKTTASPIKTSNDYMLDIAQECSQPETARALKGNTLTTVEISLLELMKKHNVPLNQKQDLPLVALGISSLTCVLITSSIYQQFSVEIAPFELLKPDFTFHKLLQYLLGRIKANEEKKSSILPSQAINTQLSVAQKKLWDEEHIFLKTNRNHMFSAYEIEEGINLDVMENSFIQLMVRHDSLRLSFSEHYSEPSLQLNTLESIPFKINIFSSDHDADIKHYVTQFRQKPFDLSQAPLFRVSFIRSKGKNILLFCIHHIIHDGWSLNILLGELTTIYNAYNKQIPLADHHEPLSYLKFIQWQQQHISQELLEKQRAFWKKQLTQVSKLDLIYDKIKKEQQQNRNHRISFKINARITAKLKQISTTNQATLYHTLISSFGLFLSHYADQNDINFITALSGRHHAHTAQIIGLFTSLILIRMTIENQESFNELVQKNKKIIDRIITNQDLPFNEIIQLTGERVSSKIHAFNQAGFIFQSYPINHLVINDKICKRVFADDKAELIYDKCDECRFGNLICFMQEYKAELHGMFEYNTTLFDANRIRHMIHSFKTLLKHISEIPDGPARSIPLLSAKQYNLLFNKWNQPKIHSANTTGLLHHFDEQVKTRAQALAVIHNESQITYDELNTLSNQLAQKLKQEGIQYEMPVGIALANSIDRIIAMLGIIKAGGCYIPLELDLPVYRMKNIINDAQLVFIITDNKIGLPIIKLHFPGLKPILINDTRLRDLPNEPLVHPINPKQLAYIMYTSGSTGTPKGIAIEQNSIVRLVKSSNYIEINASDYMAQTSSFLFDAATFEIWGALLNGATLVLVDKNILLNAQALDALIKSKKISILFLTTQLFHVYAHLAPYMFRDLNYIVVGGEAVSYEAIKCIFSPKNKPHCFINGYGPTENTTFSTTYAVRHPSDLSNPVPIGSPITGTQAYVLDHALNPRPIGAPGILYLGGLGLARGYVNRDELNKAKYIDYLGERLYNTGDLVIWKTDGTLQYLGRQDNQIKINGHRIELDEIEVQLKTHRSVMQAIVLIKSTHHHRQLAAYVLLKPGNELHQINLYHYLKTRLPEYMLPKLYYQIDDIPLTSQGKVDKKTLLKKKLSAVSYTEYAPPENELQEQLIDIYAKILNSSSAELGINAEFFDFGGNSISALHLIDKINQQFKVTITFSDIYEHAHVKALSEKITELLSYPSKRDKTKINGSDFADKSLKLLKAGDPKKTPIVFVHPIGGTGFCYLDLIRLLPDTQPCYIIQDPSIEADHILFEDMPTMAAYYIKLLLKTNSSIPFILAGYSFGGMLSLEMVSQLEKQQLGHIVHSVIALDTWVISDFMNTEAKEALRQSIMKKYSQVASELSRERIDPKPWMELYYYRLQNLGFAYNPPIINKKIILFKANQQLNEFSAMNDPTNYLNAHTSQNVDVYPVPGTHDSILQYPHVNNISRLLSQYLEDKLH